MEQEEIVLQLDRYNNLVMRALYNCQKSEDDCRKMIKKLKFYSRNEVLDMHADQLMRKGEYDISRLEEIPFIPKGTAVSRVIPLESNWIAVEFCDKKTRELVTDKILYISNDGVGLFSLETKEAYEGIVPESVYLKAIELAPDDFLMLNEKYFDGTHNDFIEQCFVKIKTILEGFMETVMEQKCSIEEYEKISTEFYRSKDRDKDLESKLKLIEMFIGLYYSAKDRLDKSVNNKTKLEQSQQEQP